MLRLNAPSTALWIISLILGVLGILVEYKFIHIASLTHYSFVLLMVGFIVLVIATLVRRF